MLQNAQICENIIPELNVLSKIIPLLTQTNCTKTGAVRTLTNDTVQYTNALQDHCGQKRKHTLFYSRLKETNAAHDVVCVCLSVQGCGTGTPTHSNIHKQHCVWDRNYLTGTGWNAAYHNCFWSYSVIQPKFGWCHYIDWSRTQSALSTCFTPLTPCLSFQIVVCAQSCDKLAVFVHCNMFSNNENKSPADFLTSL